MTHSDFAHSGTERRDHVERALWSLTEHCIAHIMALLGRVVESRKNLDNGSIFKWASTKRAQLTKNYMVKTSCNQLLLIDWFCYEYAHQDLFLSCHNVAMSLYNINIQLPIISILKSHESSECTMRTGLVMKQLYVHRYMHGMQVFSPVQWWRGWRGWHSSGSAHRRRPALLSPRCPMWKRPRWWVHQRWGTLQRQSPICSDIRRREEGEENGRQGVEKMRRWKGGGGEREHCYICTRAKQ